MKWVILFLIGCGSNPYERNGYRNVTNYSTQPNAITPNGILVDTTNFEINLNEIDQRTDFVESCLEKLFPDNILPPEIVAHAKCLYNQFDPKSNRYAIQILVAPDTHLSARECGSDLDGVQEIFPCSANYQICLDKGLPVSSQCPCECRGAIQDNHIIITTPNFHLYNADLIRLQTSCNNIWGTILQQCYQL